MSTIAVPDSNRQVTLSTATGECGLTVSAVPAGAEPISEIIVTKAALSSTSPNNYSQAEWGFDGASFQLRPMRKSSTIP